MTRDTQNNSILYNYRVIDGSFLPDRIQSGVGTTPGDRRIVFTWISRPDISVSYAAGGYSRSSQQLREIRTEAAGQLARSLGSLDFDQDGLADLLGTIDGRFAIRSLTRERSSNLAIPGRWRLMETADFDGNGWTDFLRDDGTGFAPFLIHFQCAPNADGSLAFCNQTQPPVLGDYTVSGINDFDGDGLPDILFDWNGSGR
jgi:hypothetical protein